MPTKNSYGITLTANWRTYGIHIFYSIMLVVSTLFHRIIIIRNEFEFAALRIWHKRVEFPCLSRDFPVFPGLFSNFPDPAQNSLTFPWPVATMIYCHIIKTTYLIGRPNLYNENGLLLWLDHKETGQWRDEVPGVERRGLEVRMGRICNVIRIKQRIEYPRHFYCESNIELNTNQWI